MSIPVCIVTGFLGSGKTTLLRNLLPLPTLRGTAVIVNEFGEIGIDHDLVAESTDEVVSLPNGCLCCSVRGELSVTLDRLYRRWQARELPALDRVIVETTGLADPLPIQRLLTGDPMLQGRFRTSRVVSVVDAVNGLATLDKWDESIRQVAVADWIQLSKTDLAEAERVAQVIARIRKINPGATLSANVSNLLENPDALFAQEDVADWIQHYAGEMQERERAVLGEVPHKKHLAGVRSFSLAYDQPVSMRALELFLLALQDNAGDRLLRFKGLVNTVESPQKPAVVHGAQSLFHGVSSLRSWPSDDRRTRFVFITSDISEELVQELFSMSIRMTR